MVNFEVEYESHFAYAVKTLAVKRSVNGSLLLNDRMAANRLMISGIKGAMFGLQRRQQSKETNYKHISEDMDLISASRF